MTGSLGLIDGMRAQDFLGLGSAYLLETETALMEKMLSCFVLLVGLLLVDVMSWQLQALTL